MNKKALIAILQAGLTQKEIAQQMGCKQPNVSDWLNGKRSPSPKNLIKLAFVIGKSPHEVADLLEMSSVID